MHTVSSRKTIPTVLAFAALAAVAPRPALAVWPPFGRALCTAPGEQFSPAVATDGAHGAIVTWIDLRDAHANVFARRVLGAGEADPAWPINGRALRTDPLAIPTQTEDPAFPVIALDGAGGAIVAWQESRSVGGGADIFAQHVRATGEVDPAWPANGIPVCVIDGVQDIPAIASDGAGGAIVTWFDSRPGASVVDVYAQHVLASGAVDPRWPLNGAAVSTAPAAQAFPVIVAAGAGGAIIAWADFRSSTSSIDIYAQHVLNSGVVDPAWPVDGRALCTAPNEQSNPKIVFDAAGGAIVSWTDARSPGTTRVFAQHVLASGAVDPAWPLNGRIVTSGGTSSEESPNLVSDGSGGVIVTWLTRINGSPTLHAQHVLGTGVVDPDWPTIGRVLNNDGREKAPPAIASDGAGGAIVVWQQDADILAHRVLASGALDPTYPANGRVVCNLPSDQRDPVVVASGVGGAIVAWTDTRNGAGTDIFALQVQVAGTVDVPAVTLAGVAFARLGPNPTSGPFTLRFSLPRPMDIRLAIYDASGRRVRDLASGARAAGEYAITWDLRNVNGRSVGAGLYFARLEVDRLVLTQKLVTMR